MRASKIQDTLTTEMKMKNRILRYSSIFFMLLGMSNALSAQESTQYNLNTLSPNYNYQARFEYSQSDVISFIYKWFAGFDHQVETGYFLKHLQTPVDIEYPDFPVRSKDDFCRWYKGVTDNIAWNAHAVRNIEVSGNQSNGWHVSYDVNWTAKDYNKKEYALTVHQEVDLIRYGDIFKITKLRAYQRSEKHQDTHLTALMKAAGKGDVALVKDLISKGANIFALDPITGTSVVHFAAQGGNVDVMKVLIENGAEAIINLQAASNNFTPLMVATWYQNPDMIRYLLMLEHINPLLTDNYGRTADQFPVVAMGYSELHAIDKEIKAIYAAYFKKRDAYMSKHFEADGITPKHLPKDVNLPIPNGNKGVDYHTAALVAARDNNVALFDKMIENGADLTHEGEYMKAIVAHKAGYMGNADIMRRIVKHPDFVKIKNAQGPTNGYTPLHDAIWHGHTETAKILIDAGVDTTIRAWDGMTPLELAQKLGYDDIVMLLQK